MNNDKLTMKQLGGVLVRFGDRAARPAGGVRDDVALGYYLAGACVYRAAGDGLEAETVEVLELASLLLVPQLGEPASLSPDDLGTAEDALEASDLCRLIAEVLDALPREEQIYGTLRDFLADDGLLIQPLLERLVRQCFAVAPPPVVTWMLQRLELTLWGLATCAACSPCPTIDGALAFATDAEVETILEESIEALRTWTAISEEDRRAFEAEFGLDDDEDLGGP